MTTQAKNNAIQAKTLIQAFNDKPIVIYPIYLLLTGDYATAAALAQVLYWHKAMGRKFYKTDADFCAELYLTPKQFERVKINLKKLDFLKIKAEGIPAKTFYDVDYELLAAKISETSSPQNGETGTPPKDESSSPQKGETNTENTNTDYTENNNIMVDVEIGKLFSKTEQPAAKKILKSIATEKQLEVLTVLFAMIKTSKITNKVGYLKAIVDSVIDGSFIPVPEPSKPMTTAQRIEKEKKEQQAREVANKVDNAKFFADLEKKYGAVIPESVKKGIDEMKKAVKRA
jgi:hypothetical protein